MREEFIRLRGYDPLSYLPAMTGRVVGSLEISERFLWDLRRTISELVVENYAGHLHELANDAGMRFTIEAYGSPCDNLPYAGKADEPMGEFWTPSGAMETCKAMASAGHIYGKPIIGAEAFTADSREKWLHHPASIKALGDRAFCEGINRFVFHRYAMQPWEPMRVPGMTMGPWGLHYERSNTWWELTGPWHTYLARCQQMLRQGTFVADICYLQNEAPPQTFRGLDRKGYEWDECPAEAVIDLMSVKDGRIVLPGGMSYRLLALPESRAMTPRLLGKIKELVEAGATVVGPPPTRSPSLSDYPKCDEEVRQIAHEMWGDAAGKQLAYQGFGKGRVVWGASPEEVLRRDGMRQDFQGPQQMRYIHRVAGDTDIYFVSNQQPYATTETCTFRVSGKVPELWWPDTGRIERASVYREKDGVTDVALPLGPSGSVFVVFRGGSTTPSPTSMVVGVGSTTLFPTGVVVGGGSTTLSPTGNRSVGEGVVLPPPPIAGVSHNGKPVISTTAKPPLKITVRKAVYGVLDDPARTRDVIDRVRKKLGAREYTFQVADMAAGDDPAFGIVKTLIIDYTCEGKHLTARATDPEMIMLGAGSEPMPVCELQNDGRRLMLTAWESGRFTIARGNGKKIEVTVPILPASKEINGPWEVRFPEGLGAPERITLDRPASWTENSDPGVKHFSGTATYRTTFDLPKDLLSKGRVARLDLGDVQVIAQVKLNGRDLGVLWKQPFSVDVRDALRPGRNELEIKVTNLLINRMIGDEQLPEDSDRNGNGTLKSWPKWLDEGKPSPTGRVTFTSWRLWGKDSPLLPSGLLGPVTLRMGYETTVE